jgi:hypothetical protein
MDGGASFHSWQKENKHKAYNQERHRRKLEISQKHTLDTWNTSL